MDPMIVTMLASLFGTVAGGTITFLLNRQQYEHQIKLLAQQQKTEFIAEHTVTYYLSHQSYTDRSFDTLKERLGGFSDDELRKILVRAGAVRTFRDDGSEWWRLLSRNEEYGIKKRRKQEEKNAQLLEAAK